MMSPNILLFDGVPIKPVDIETNGEIYHMADKVNRNGEIYALCFESPRAIDIDRELWTTDISAVTCSPCNEKFAHEQKNKT